MDLEVKFALDQMVIYSFENEFLVARQQHLFNTLVQYTFEVMEKLYSGRSNDLFYGYKDLFELECMGNSVFQKDCLPTIVESNVLADRMGVLGVLFRNLSMVAENVEILAKHPGFSKIVILMLNLPLPQEAVEFLEGGDGCVVTCGRIDCLEHRKNAVIILQNIASEYKVENVETMNLIINICKDFISEPNHCYVYPSVDLLAKLLINVQHQQFLLEVEGIVELVEMVLELLPIKAFAYETAQTQMALYELVMLVLCVLTNLSHMEKSQIITKHLSHRMLALSKRPLSTIRMPIEIIKEFWSVRERALRIYLDCLKYLRMSLENEKELVMMMSIAQREGDLWMSAAILEFLVEYEN